jgi:hypothetical protein
MTLTTLSPRRLICLVAAAAAMATVLVQAIAVTDAHAGVSERVSYVKAGDYRTLATLWNTNAEAAFDCPAGAKIRVRYGGGWFAKNRQQQTLNCASIKKLSVGKWSVLVARMQIKVPETGYVHWNYITTGP